MRLSDGDSYMHEACIPGEVDWTHFLKLAFIYFCAAGMQAMLKDGHQMFSGLDEAVMKNIDACKQLSLLTKTSMGPNGK